VATCSSRSATCGGLLGSGGDSCAPPTDPNQASAPLASTSPPARSAHRPRRSARRWQWSNQTGTHYCRGSLEATYTSELSGQAKRSPYRPPDSGRRSGLTTRGGSRGGTLVRWRPGFPSTFPPPDARPRRTGRNRRGRRVTAEAVDNRLCTSRAMIGRRWGATQPLTCENTAASPELTTSRVRAEPLCLGRLLQNRLHLDEQLDRVADHHTAAVHGDVGGDVEVLAVDLAGG
jgi:hypothetical protein